MLNRMNIVETPPKAASLVWSLFVAFLLSACGEKTVAVSYIGYNHTDKSIVSIVVNGEGGVLLAPAHDGGGQACCVEIPKKWKPGLKATIKWQEGGTFKRNEKGDVVKVNGVPVVIDGAWKERAVEVPKYDETGDFYIHFVPGDEVKVAVALYGPRSPRHPYHFADVPLISP